MNKQKISHDERVALTYFAFMHGRYWRAALDKQWQAACYPGASPRLAAILQGLRNAGYFGPRGLRKIRINLYPRRTK